MSAAPPPRFSTSVEDDSSARTDASEAEGAKRAPQDLLSSLAARERVARERAAEAEVAAQRAAENRRAVEERLARRRAAAPRLETETPAPPSAPVQLEMLKPAPAPSGDVEAGAGELDPQLLAQIDAAERSLARLIDDGRRLGEELRQLEREAEQRSAQIAPAEAQLEELRAQEQGARQRLETALATVDEASSQAATAHADARREAQQAREAMRLAESADDALEAIVGERSSAFQRAIEHATLEQDASARAGAARRAAQQAAAQRLAAEQALDGTQRAQRLARLRAAIESSIEAASEGEGIEGEAAPQPAQEAPGLEARPPETAPSATAERVEIAELPVQIEAAAASPEPAEELHGEAAEAERSGWQAEIEAPGSPQESEDDAGARPVESPWWLAGGAQQEDEGWDEGDESSRADEQDQRFLENLFSEDAFRGEAESAIAEQAAESETLDETPEPRFEPAARPPILSPLRPRPEPTPAQREAASPRRERAAAELARIERVASQQGDAVRKARQAEGQRVEAERDAYEAAASQWRSRQQSSSRGPGLYAEHDYAWEEQAAIGVQRKLAREEEVERRRRSAQQAAEQAVAAQRAAEQLRAPSTAASESLRTVIISCVAFGLSVIVLAWLVLYPRTPEPVAVAEPAPAGLATLETAPPAELAPAPVNDAMASVPNEAVASSVSEPAMAASALDPVGAPASSELGRPAVQVPEVSAASVALAPATRTKPELREEDWPAWRRYAVAAPEAGGKPIIAIVIDDMGSNREVSAKVIELPPPITVSFFPWVQRLERQVEVARAAGHEIMAHVPMEPQARAQDPGPNYLGMTQSAQEIRARLRWNLDKFDFGIVGINNHMGSRFTSSGPGMGVVMAELLKRQMLFLDSRTTRDSVGGQMAAEFGLPYAVNDLFLDNEVSAEGVTRRLAELEARARRKGSAIAIGHPHLETVEALRAWIPRAEKSGFLLVPLSAVVKHQMARRAAAAAANTP